jgi:GMP synthase (glutamine-hydrolysing)
MTVIAVIHHLEPPFTGHAGEPLIGHGARIREVDRLAGDELPALEGIDALVTLGGDQSVLDVERDPLLREEVLWLRDAVARGLPVLGICLGAQLLAHALGGSVFRMPRCNLAWKPMDITDEGREDVIAGALERPTGLFWNHDAIVPPSGAVELLVAPGEGCAAYRYGERAWGLQFHPEVTRDVLEDWWERSGSDQLARSGADEARARAADAEHLGGQAALSEVVFGRFAAFVSDIARSRQPSSSQPDRSQPPGKRRAAAAR